MKISPYLFFIIIAVLTIQSVIIILQTEFKGNNYEILKESFERCTKTNDLLINNMDTCIDGLEKYNKSLKECVDKHPMVDGEAQ